MLVQLYQANHHWEISQANVDDAADDYDDDTSDDDEDGDGYVGTEHGGDDCDDSDASINPSVADAWYDGIDSNCDGKDDYDDDHSGSPKEVEEE